MAFALRKHESELLSFSDRCKNRSKRFAAKIDLRHPVQELIQNTDPKHCPLHI
jgi:hypothetical protein